MGSTENDNPLNRYTRIIETVGSARDGMTLSAIARGAGLQAPTAHRLVRSLCEVGLLEMVEGEKLYILGPRLLRLLHGSAIPASILTVAQPILRSLVASLDETAFLTRLAGVTVEAVALERPTDTLRAFVHPGRDMPMHAAATGKAILAFQDEAFVARVLSQPRPRYTDNTLVGEAEIRTELTAIRADGFAICDNELDPGVLGYACPVKLDGRNVFYALGVCGLAERFRHIPRDTVKRILTDAARALSERPIDLAA